MQTMRIIRIILIFIQYSFEEVITAAGKQIWEAITV